MAPVVNRRSSWLRAPALDALVLVAGLLLPAPELRALEALTFEAGPAAGHDWSVDRLTSRLRFLPDGGLSMDIDASGVRLPEPLDEIRGLSAHCPRARVESGAVDCRDGTIEVTNAPGWPTLAPAAFRFRYGAGRFALGVEDLRVGGGRLRIDAAGSGRHWSLELEADELPLALLRLIAGDRLPDGGVSVTSGRVSGTFGWQSEPRGGTLSTDLRVAGLEFSDAAGLNVGENLALHLNLEASRERGPWRYAFRAGLTGGGLYLHPVFVDAAGHPVRFSAEGTLEDSARVLRISRFGGVQDGVVTLAGRALLGLEDGSVRPLELEVDADLDGLQSFHATYLKPWLVDTALGGAKLEGDVEATIDWRSRGPARAELKVNRLSLDDAQARYGIFGVDGILRWSSDGSVEDSQLNWQGAHFYRIDIGGGQVRGRLSGSRFELREPALLPLLGGVLAVEDLLAEGLGSAEPAWRFRGRLTPISLAELSNRLAWPPFAGTLSGMIPSVRYAGGEVSIDGALSMEIFEGNVRISNLKLSQPFGVVPRAAADIELSDLSLDALTRTFSFGNIQGRLDGRIDNLVLENWRPAEFDAEFATPEDDASRHRISQRAVENLASLGGAGRVLSSTVLRFFETFSYEKLGIRCRLRNGICEMGGVEPAERGYYIVKGGGLPPRIDVLGFNDSVDWNKLVQRLKAARLDQAVIR